MLPPRAKSVAALRATLTFAHISEILYHEKGVLRWKKPLQAQVKTGDIAGYINHKGYRQIGLCHRAIPAHQIVWLLEHGEWPNGPLDHIDTNKDNNAPDNLRICTQSQNNANKNSYRGTSTKFKGVTLHKKTGKFQAAIKDRYLGLFATAEEAAAAYDAAASKLFGEFARTNFGSAQIGALP